MCGRFVQLAESDELEIFYNAISKTLVTPNYNVTPQSDIPVIVYSKKAQQNQIHLFRWGLIPKWSQDESISSKLINARAETIEIKPSFKKSFVGNRCIIPASGFYEWQKDTKQPYYIFPKSNIFSFAGIWENWKNSNGETILTCAIITTNANKSLSEIHERIPVILSQEEVDLWLDPNASVVRLKELLNPIKDEEIKLRKISTQVNNPKNNAKDLIKSIT